MSVVGPKLQPTLFERSRPGRGDGKIPHPPKDALDRLPPDALRDTPPALPELNEPEVVRHYVNLSQLNYAVDTGFYPLGSCTMKFNPKLNEWAARLPGFATPPSDGPRRGGAGHAAAPVGARAGADGDQRHARGIAPAGGRSAGRADRDPHDPRPSPGPRRHGADRRARAGFQPRHEPRHGVDGRLPDDHDPVGARRRRGRRCVPRGAWSANGRGDDHEPLDARPVREAHR